MSAKMMTSSCLKDPLQRKSRKIATMISLCQRALHHPNLVWNNVRTHLCVMIALSDLNPSASSTASARFFTHGVSASPRCNVCSTTPAFRYTFIASRIVSSTTATWDTCHDSTNWPCPSASASTPRNGDTTSTTARFPGHIICSASPAPWLPSPVRSSLTTSAWFPAVPTDQYAAADAAAAENDGSNPFREPTIRSVEAKERFRVARAKTIQAYVILL